MSTTQNPTTTPNHWETNMNAYLAMKKPPEVSNSNTLALSIAMGKMGRELKTNNKKATKDNKDKIKQNALKIAKKYKNMIFSNPKLYQMFIGSYAYQNPKLIGEFKEQFDQCIKKIGSLNFENLSENQIQSKVNGIFKEDIQGDAMQIAEDMHEDMVKHREEIIKARVEQYYRIQQQHGKEDDLTTLTMDEVARIIENSPAMLAHDENVSDSKNLNNNLGNTEFNKVLGTDVDGVRTTPEQQFDTASIKVETPNFNDITDTSPQFDFQNTKAQIEEARLEGKSVHIESMFDVSQPVSFTYDCTPDQFKDYYTSYLQAFADQCGPVDSCTLMSNVSFNNSQYQKCLEYQDAINVAYDETTMENAVTYTFDVDPKVVEYYTNLSNLTPVSESTDASVSMYYSPNIYQYMLGDSYIEDMYTIAHEVMPDTKLYYGDKNLDDPEVCKDVVDHVLNPLRDEENRTGEDLFSGVSIDYSYDTDHTPNMEVLSAFVDCIEKGESDVRLDNIEAIPVTQKDGQQLPKEEVVEKQKEIFESAVTLTIENPYTITGVGYAPYYEYSSTPGLNMSDYEVTLNEGQTLESTSDEKPSKTEDNQSDKSETIVEVESGDNSSYTLSSSIVDENGDLREDVGAQMMMDVLHTLQEEKGKLGKKPNFQMQEYTGGEYSFS